MPSEFKARTQLGGRSVEVKSERLMGLLAQYRPHIGYDHMCRCPLTGRTRSRTPGPNCRHNQTSPSRAAALTASPTQPYPTRVLYRTSLPPMIYYSAL